MATALLHGLRQSSAEGGPFFNCKKKIIVDTERPEFFNSSADLIEPWHVSAVEGAGVPNDVIRDMNVTFGGEFWLEGVLSLRDGHLINNMFTRVDTPEFRDPYISYKWDVRLVNSAHTVREFLVKGGLADAGKYTVWNMANYLVGGDQRKFGTRWKRCTP